MDVETSAKVNGFHTSPSSSDLSLGPADVLDYISSLLALTLGASQGDLELEGNPLSEAERDKTLGRCSSFLSSPRVALYASKRELQLPQSNGDVDAPSTFLATSHTHV